MPIGRNPNVRPLEVTVTNDNDLIWSNASSNRVTQASLPSREARTLSTVIGGQKVDVFLQTASTGVRMMFQSSRGSFRREILMVQKFVHRRKHVDLMQLSRREGSLSGCPFGLRVVNVDGEMQVIREVDEPGGGE